MLVVAILALRRGPQGLLLDVLHEWVGCVLVSAVWIRSNLASRLLERKKLGLLFERISLLLLGS